MSRTIEIEENSFIVRVKGKDYEVTYPTVSQTKSYHEELVVAKNAVELTEALIAHLDRLGLPREVTESMQEKSVQKIIKALKESEEEEKKS